MHEGEVTHIAMTVTCIPMARTCMCRRGMMCVWRREHGLHTFSQVTHMIETGLRLGVWVCKCVAVCTHGEDTWKEN